MSLSTSRLTPELPYLDVFAAVCAEGGFTAAARRLGCSQPAISYQIRALERTLGAKLVERGGRRVLLTSAGERVKSFCSRFFGELARVREECRGRPVVETLRIGSASGFGRYVLVPALKRLNARRAAPTFGLDLRFDAADVVLRRLERGECEAAFLYSRSVSNRLRHRRVYDEELVLIGAPSLKRRLHGKLMSLGALASEPFITYEESDYVFGRWFEAVFSEQPDAIQSVAHFSELEEVIDYVAAGAGLSIVPRDAAAGMVARRKISVLSAGKGTPCFNQVYLVVRSGSALRPEIQELSAIIGAGSRA